MPRGVMTLIGAVTLDRACIRWPVKAHVAVGAFTAATDRPSGSRVGCDRIAAR